jgi:hypothetical protein
MCANTGPSFRDADAAKIKGGRSARALLTHQQEAASTAAACVLGCQCCLLHEHTRICHAGVADKWFRMDGPLSAVLALAVQLVYAVMKVSVTAHSALCHPPFCLISNITSRSSEHAAVLPCPGVNSSSRHLHTSICKLHLWSQIRHPPRNLLLPIIPVTLMPISMHCQLNPKLLRFHNCQSVPVLVSPLSDAS